MFDGVLIINKPRGLTSHDVVYKIKKLIKEKVGHTGTLDPMATGVLPICIGQATKIAQFVLCKDKKYLAEIKFGIETDSFDITGKVLNRKKFIYSEQKILSCIKNFIGAYLQEVPIFSAIKYKGKKLYEFARAGIDVELKKRMAEIYDIKLIKIVSKDRIWLEINCAKGVYIRSICHDIGKAYGCGACLNNLIRLASGNFLIKNSISLAKCKNLLKNNLLLSRIIKIDQALDFKKVIISSEAKKILYNGNKISIKFVVGEKNFCFGEKLFVYDDIKRLIGIYEFRENYLCPVRIFTGDFYGDFK